MNTPTWSEPLSSLAADPGHPGDVVRRIAPKGLEVDEAGGLEPVALADLVGPVDERVGDPPTRHQSLDRLGHQLQAVQVAGDDGHRVASIFRDAGEVADDVVSLEPGHAVDRDREGGQHLAYLL